ncbi:hypothetical protein Tco_0011434 [Tanacetum coccineum]
MIACLEKSEGNVDFHEIVDLLTASTIHYALTISHTIYASYIEQFWSIAKTKTINNEMQIHATVNGKTIVISESSVRSDLQFNDEYGTVNSFVCNNVATTSSKSEGCRTIPPEPLNEHTSTLNPRTEEQILLLNQHHHQNTQTLRQALQEDTQLSQTSMPIPNVADEAVFKERDDRVVRATTTDASLDAAHASEAIGPFPYTIGLRGYLQKYLPYDSFSEVNTSGSGEDSMEHQDDLTDFVPPTPYDLPLLGGYTPGSDEGRPNINELMAICTKLSNRVLALETSKTAQDLVIKKLKKKVKRLEKKLRARTLGMKLFKIGTSKRKSLDKENVSKQGRNLKIRLMFKECDFDDDFDDIDDMVNEAMENVKGDTVNAGGAVNTATTGVSTASASVTTAGVLLMRSQKDKEKGKGAAFRAAQEESARPTRILPTARPTRILPTIDPKYKGKGIIMDADALLDARLQEEEKEQFSINEQARFLVETIAERKRFFAAQRAEQIRNKPPTKTQLRNKMITFLKNMGRFTYNQLKNKSLEEIQKLYEREQKWINDFVPMDSDMVKDSRKKDDDSQKQTESSKKRPRAEHDEESVKKQKLEDDTEKEELKACLDIVSGEDIVINVESLATKYPIFDWKTHSDRKHDVLSNHQS